MLYRSWPALRSHRPPGQTRDHGPAVRLSKPTKAARIAVSARCLSWPSGSIGFARFPHRSFSSSQHSWTAQRCGAAPVLTALRRRSRQVPKCMMATNPRRCAAHLSILGLPVPKRIILARPGQRRVEFRIGRHLKPKGLVVIPGGVSGLGWATRPYCGIARLAGRPAVKETTPSPN
jgi:hypothetical protein